MPADPEIVVRGSVAWGSHILSQDIASGSAVTFDNLGAGFDVQAAVHGLKAYGCFDQDDFSQSTFRVFQTSPGSDHMLDAHLVCRSGTIALDVTGLPTGISSTVDFVSPGAPVRADTSYTVSSGQNRLAVYPHSGVRIFPRVVIAGNKAFKAPNLTVDVASRDTMALTIAYAEVADALALALSPSTLVVAPGTTAQTGVTVSRGGLSLGDVTFDLLNPPNGIAAVFSPSTTPLDASTATISVPSTLADGIYSVTVQATAGGVTSTATLTLDVRAPAFTMAASRTSLTVLAGDTGSVDLSFARNATALGPITLSRSATPAAVTAAYDNAAPTGSNARLTFTSAPTATADTIPVIVTAVFGTVTRTVTVTLEVLPLDGNRLTIAAPASISVEQGLNATVPLMIARSGSFATAAIAIGVSAPTMQGQAWSAPAVAFGSQAQIELSTTANSPLATHKVAVTATANGGTVVRTVEIDVTVQPRAGPDFALVPAQKAITVAHGQSGRVDLMIVRYAGFDKAIKLSVPDAILSMFATFTPATAAPTDDVAVLRLSLDDFYMSPGVPVGTYALVIEGSAPGGPIRRVAVSLVVVAAPTP